MALEAKLSEHDCSQLGATPHGQSDGSILAGLETNASWAASALFDRLESVVERALYRVLQQRGNDFEDLVQITFERIVRTLVERRFSAQCSLSTWASAIATNVAIDSVRARVRERRIFAAESIDLADRELSLRGMGTDRVEVRAEVSRLQTVLAQMNPGQAEAVFLHDVMGHDLAEVAVIAGVTVAAAQSRLVRGRKEFMRRATKTPLGREAVDGARPCHGRARSDVDGGQLS
jgi:RNA polymerase sigma-70 factor (ECF subfamily)